MEIIRGEHNLRARHRGCVATIGNFDGVHRGHQAVLRALLREAAAVSAVPTVVIFEPQPSEYFSASNPPARLTRLREKAALLAELGIERLLVLPFNAALASWPAEDFVQRLLVDGLGVKGVIIGDDFKFGSDRSGDFAMLQRFGAARGFFIRRADSFLTAGERVSSTSIRQLLRDGLLRDVSPLLGRPYSMSGRVVHGQRRGRQMGFPTANLDLHRRASPVQGIFAARVRGLGPKALPAIAYVGDRPIIRESKWVLEVHLFDFAGDLYGRRIAVDFVDKIRNDLPFTTFEALAEQIANDCAEARRRLAQIPAHA